MLFCQNFYNNVSFPAKVYTLHATHIDHFWCLSSKYTEYDNIFYQTIVTNFAAKIFQPKAHQVKFS